MIFNDSIKVAIAVFAGFSYYITQSIKDFA